MRRVALTTIATIAGLVLLLQFKVHSTESTTGALVTITTSPGATSATPRTSASRPAAKHRGSSAAATTNASPTPTHHRHHVIAAPTTRTITGQTVDTRYGPVQVQIVETGSQLTNVTALQLPNTDSHSAEIAAAAVPILRNEALTANSAHIDVVSGATYTSNGYAQSLQSALDNA